MEVRQIRPICRKPAYFLTEQTFLQDLWFFTVVTEKITVFWAVNSCSAVQISLQGRRIEMVRAGYFKDWHICNRKFGIISQKIIILTNIFIVVPCCMLFQSLLYCSNSCTPLHFKILKSHTKTLCFSVRF